MKKVVVTIFAAIIVLAGVTTLLLTHHSKAKTNSGGTTASKAGYTVVDACSIFTSSIAEQILGSTAVKATSPSSQSSSDDVLYTNCIYSAGPNVDPPHMTSVAVRSAKDSTGADGNKTMFTATGKPAGAQDVAGYGDAAYWDPSLGQLDILKGNNWYIVSNYTGTSPSNGTATVAMAEQLAQKLSLR